MKEDLLNGQISRCLNRNVWKVMIVASPAKDANRPQVLVNPGSCKGSRETGGAQGSNSVEQAEARGVRRQAAAHRK